MNLTKNQIDIKLKEINKLLENELFEEVYRQCIQLDNDLKESKYFISENNYFDKEAIADLYAMVAYILFSSSEYDLFFEMYILAQNYGYSSTKRREFLNKAFIEPNLDDFSINYETNINKLMNHKCIKRTMSFEDLPYLLITTGIENEFYLYEKKTDSIKEKFKFELGGDIYIKDSNVTYEDYLIINNDDWMELQSYIKEIGMKGYKCYLIENNIDKFLSYLQAGIMNDEYLSGLAILQEIEGFKKYFKNNNYYLPRQVIGNDDEKIIYEKEIQGIHQFRLTKQNRFGDNVLLSICIPSFNRGERAHQNIVHILKTELDEEIEVILSNNGTKNESKSYYEKIKQIEDSRLIYFEFEENQGASLNLCKVVDIAKGKYVLLLSDEDLIDLDKLKAIFVILRSKIKDLAIIRTKTDFQGIVPFIGLANSGEESLLEFGFTSNYMSGLIFNKQMLDAYKLTDKIRSNLDNEACVYYPHMVWELILCQYGKVFGADTILINEGKPEKTNADLAEIGNEDKSEIKSIIQYYATLEGRLAQHNGFFKVIENMEISVDDFDIFRKLYKRLCNKTLILVAISTRVYYKEIGVDGIELLEAAYNESLKLLDQIYFGKKNSAKFKYTEDRKEIKKIYQDCKRSL